MRVTFGDFVLDRGTRQLRRGGEERRLGPKAFDLLELLLTQRPNVVSRERIRDRLWPGTSVSESTLNTVVAELRAALVDDPKRPSLVRTVYGVGFAFSGVATDSGTGTAARPRVYRLVLDGREVMLRPGENVLGRDESVAVWLDSSTVSRRHARILVEGGQVLIEDLASKNGTYVRGERICSQTLLADGEVFRLGGVIITLRSGLANQSTRSDPMGLGRLLK